MCIIEILGINKSNIRIKEIESSSVSVSESEDEENDKGNKNLTVFKYYSIVGIL